MEKGHGKVDECCAQRFFVDWNYPPGPQDAIVTIRIMNHF